MYSFLLLATRWRADGTPRPDIKLVSNLVNGNPWAWAFLGAMVIYIVRSALNKSGR